LDKEGEDSIEMDTIPALTGTSADWLLVLISALAAIFALFQLNANRRSAREQLRAYLVCRLEIVNSDPGRTKVFLELKNHGKTPARKCIIHFSHGGWHGLKSINHLPFLTQQGISMIPPGATFRYFLGYVDASSNLLGLTRAAVTGTIKYSVSPDEKSVSETITLTLQDFAGAVRVKTRKQATKRLI
jgi:hypothetical protein